MTDLLAIATNLAARYASPNLPATPAQARPIVSATADLPDQLGATPCVVVFPTGGTLKQGPGAHRGGLLKYAVRLYYDQSPGGDLERDTRAIAAWVSLLVDQLATDADLGGTVVIARTTGFTIGRLLYAGTGYSGAELTVEAVADAALTVAA